MPQSSTQYNEELLALDAVPPYVDVLRRVAKLLIAGALTLAALVWIGWSADLPELASFGAATPMNPLSAFAIACGAVCLYTEANPYALRRAQIGHRVSQIAASVVLFVGLVTLAGYIAGRNLGVDQIFFHGSLDGNRIAPNTGFNFFVLGTALWFLTSQKRRDETIAQALALVPFGVALVSVIGYLFGVGSLIGVADYTPMALPTALAFLLLSAGTLFARPDRGPISVITSEHAGGKAARILIPSCLIIPVVLAWLRLEGQRRGYFGLEFGLAAITVTTILVFSVVIWWLADRQNQDNILLKGARDEAEAATRSKAAFLATMSHEIRTPLNAVLGMGQLLKETKLDADQREYAETILLSGSHLLSLINDILDFSKIEGGALQLQSQAFNFTSVVEESLDLVAPRAGEKGLELTYYIAPEVPGWLVGDKGRIRQVLLNFLSNAVKFTDEGEVAVSVDVTEDHVLEPLVRVQVRDTGIGIAPEKFSKLFRSFSQVDSSPTRTYGGTGLGLAISKQLVNLMGGTVGVDSKVGAGSTFWFTFRLPRATAPPAEPGVDPDSLKGMRALIVDDNETNRRLFQVLASRWGLNVRATASSEEAIKLLDQGDPFDVIVLDYVMRDLDGVALARRIHTMPGRTKTPLLLLSSVGQRPDLGTGDSGLFAKVMSKPIRQSQLFDALQDTLVPAAVPARVRRRQDPTEPSESPGSSSKALRVLVVEDNPVNRRVALKMLEKLNIRADTATNGLEGIRRIEAQKYDVVFMDVQMPVMDGLEAARQICRRWSRSDRPRLVAMTAEAMQGDRERCLEAGMDDYVSKPVSMEALKAAIGMLGPAARTDAPSAPATNGFDPTIIRRLADDVGGADTLHQLVESYLEEATGLFVELRKALEANDQAEATRAVHTLKSTSLTFGATSLGATAKEAEQLSRAGRLDEVRALLPKMDDEFRQVRPLLETAAKDIA